MKELRFALFGAGFWARYQLSAWRELEGARCVAIYNRTRSKANQLASEFGIPSVYDNAETLLNNEDLDFIDIVTDVESHCRFATMGAERGLDVICQKPMAPTLAEAERMVDVTRSAGIKFFVHENWRWQTPIRTFHTAVSGGLIGTPFRGRIDMISGFPVFDKQPFFKDLEQFILTDLGSHILDVARLLFGEPTSLYCRTQRIHPEIKGEDVATVVLGFHGGATVTCNMAYAGTPLEHEHFPQTYIFVEAERGSAELDFDYWIRCTDWTGTQSRRVPPPRHSWADPAYDLAHASIVPCCANLLGALRGTQAAETTGDDNLKTVKLVFAAYESAARNAVIDLDN